MTDNPFLAYAAKVQPWAAKKAARKAELAQNRAQKKALIKVLQERDLLMRLWKNWRRDVVKASLEGPYQKQLEQLIAFLDAMKLEDERKLLKLVQAGPWTEAHIDIRYLVLRLCSTRLANLREKEDLPPFDDALPGQPLTVYQLIRARLMEKTHAG